MVEQSSPDVASHSRTNGISARLLFVTAIVVTTVSLAAVAVVKLPEAGVNQKKAAETDQAADTGKADADKDRADKTASQQTKPKSPPSKKEEEPIENPFPNRFKAPELDGGTGWLNTSGEITLKDLRGKVVLLDFWTFCCINCIHVLPDLHFLEKKYPKELVVIGVHSAKFDNEKDSENIRRAILRYEIEHPVINDSKMTVWRKFGARSWPTVILLDPEGYYCGYVSGEGNRELLDQAIRRIIAFHKAKGTLDPTPIRFDLERAKTKPTPLKFPGKLLADEKSGRLFISDSNHNRIVISTPEGKLLDIVGDGAIGLKDGAYESARFDHPQGMALVGEKLYVADTENHAIRVVDLRQKTVSTLAGTGKQARSRMPFGKVKEMALNSPWDLLHADGTLYIAMAGPHQLWHHKLGSDSISVYAGSGREDIINGSLDESAFAQPSGMATDGKFLYVADSEGSSIRKVALDPKGNVTTVVGTSDLARGRALFEFGDIDGVGDKARLQHPLGVAFHEGTLYVADSYNHKIKKIDLKKSEATTWLGDGKAGNSLDPLKLSEPAGLTIAGDKLYIADTNNHRILVADLKTRKVSELIVDGLTPPKPSGTDDSEFDRTQTFTKVKPQSVTADGTLNFKIALQLPKGYKLNKLAAVTYKLATDGEQNLIADDQFLVRRRAKTNGNTATVSVPLANKNGKATLQLALTYAFCRDGVGGLCKLKTVRWRIPVEVSADATQTAITLTAGEEP